MELRASGEDYLEAVLILGQRMGQVRAIDVSQYLGCAKTSVSHGLQLLRQGGVLFGSAGLKLLSSRDAKKAYTHATAAALRMKESVMETVTTVQENAADILASAKDLNAQRAEQETADTLGQVEEA